ncbi:hypothetical protein ACP275_02G075300 [Erythranthe tilingii]
MGRAKLNMELINKEKSRNITFKKRKEGLVRKMHEFTTLCDVGACMIIYGPKQDKAAAAGPAEPEIWPPNPEQVRRIIDIYKSKNKDSGNKNFGLSDFFHDRKRKIDEELDKLRKKNFEAKYPTWPRFLDGTTEAGLREFAAYLGNRAERVKSRIDLLRRSKEGSAGGLIHSHHNHHDASAAEFARARFGQSQPGGFFPPGGVEFRGVDLEWTNHFPIHYPPAVIDYQNPMRMFLSNDNDVQFGGGVAAAAGSTSGNFSFKGQIFYESTGPAAGRGLVDTSPRSLGRLYAPPVVPFNVRENHDGGPEDIFQYQMNHRVRYFD